jgi:multidrug efflux pump subunit AcrA (membrane-fusion protein)
MSSSSCFEAGQKAGNRILRRPTSALTVALLGAALSACNDGSTNATKPAALVRTETVQLRDRQASVTLTGEVQARFHADLSFRVSGRVTERFVDVGAHVDAGEVLARLDPAEQQADLDADGIEAEEFFQRHATPVGTGSG